MAGPSASSPSHEDEDPCRSIRSVVDGLFVFAAVLAPDGGLIELNEVAAATTDRSREEMLGRPLWDCAGWSADAVRQKLRWAVEQAQAGVTSRVTIDGDGPDGRPFAMDLQFAPVHLSGSERDGILVSGLDITEDQRFERELARMAAIEADQWRISEGTFRLAEALTGAADVGEIVAAVATLGSDLADAASCTVAIEDPKTGEVSLHESPAREAGTRVRSTSVLEADATPLDRAIRTGHAELLGTRRDIETAYSIGEDGDLSGIAAVATYPAGRAHAAVGWAWTEPVSFTLGLRSAFATVAELAGQALERATLFERERRIANDLQRSLLPARLTKIPGADVAARYEAGAAGLQVGGDWYDVCALGDDRYVLVVGDIVGRGLHAAAAMGQLRHAFTALSSNTDDLGLLVEQLDVFASEVEDARLSTMVAAEYRSEDGRLRVVGAGHLPPMVSRRDGSVEVHAGSGPPLGFDIELPRAVSETHLFSGDRLILYTDGLVERRGEGSMPAYDDYARWSPRPRW